MNSISDYFKGRAARYGERAEKLKRLLNWLSLARLILFAGGLTMTITLFKAGNLYGFMALTLSVVLFAVAFSAFTRSATKRDYYLNLSRINMNEAMASVGDYSCHDNGSRFSDPSHPFSHDIDMFGKGSVYQSLNRTTTEEGASRLAERLSSPYAGEGEISRRQEAIRELTDMEEWRHSYLATGMMSDLPADERDEFTRWIMEPERQTGRAEWALLYGLPALAVGLLAAAIAGLFSFSFFIMLFLINLLIIAFRLRKINLVHGRVSRRGAYLGVKGRLAALVASERYSSSLLRELAESLGSSEEGAVYQVKKLSAIIHAFDSRINMVAGIVLNGLLLWDLHCVARIGLWKRANRERTHAWFSSLAEAEALVALAGFASVNREFAWPVIGAGESFLEAEEMGHHLIPLSRRVTNNYSIAGSGVVNIITGANMAGKSTFLRTVTVNLVLAMCGAPVCAWKFRYTPVDIFSSMRTTDSLPEDESYFFAELKRLRLLIDRLEKGERLIFVLDEILKGTNSRDKSEGSRAFIEKVLALGGTGIVATHDISLGELEKSYPGRVVNNCFEVEIIEADVKFDYLLYKGVTTRMNAAILMKRYGII